MPKAVIMGSTCVFVSTLTPEQVDRFKTYMHEALIQTDENGEECFRLDIDDSGPGAISDERVVLSRAKSEEGKATITVLLDPTEEHKDELVMERIGRAMLHLDAMERLLAEKTDEAENMEVRVKSMITWI